MLPIHNVPRRSTSHNKRKRGKLLASGEICGIKSGVYIGVGERTCVQWVGTTVKALNEGY
jgi:hypothetical protein